MPEGRKLSYAILLPNRTLAEGEAELVVVPGAEGDFGVLKNHIQMVTKLRPGKVEARNGDETATYVISGGFADVGGDNCRIMAEKGEAADKLDLAELKEKLAALSPEEQAERRFLEAMLEAA